MHIDLPYVHTYRSRKHWYTYYRRNRQRIRINGHFSIVAGVFRPSDDWLNHYNRIHSSVEKESAEVIPSTGTIEHLVLEYLKDAEFLENKESTRDDYRRYLDLLREHYGHTRIDAYDKEAVIEIRDIYKDTPAKANYLVRVLRLLFSFAEARPRKFGLSAGWRNPARRPKALKAGKGHRPWEENEMAAFRAHWPLGTLQRTAFETLLSTGQRGIDVVKMERSHVAPSGTISVAQEKTDARVWIPQTRDLTEAIQAWDYTQAEWVDRRKTGKKKLPVPLDMERMLLTGERGRRLTVDAFRHMMIEAFQAVPNLITGLENGGVTTHGLRYTAATILSELGCDWNTVASITGHETTQMVRKYTAKKRQARIAVAAFDAASEARNKNETSGKVANRSENSG